MPWCHAGYTLDDATDWVETAESVWNDDSDYRFIIEQTESGRVLGSVAINQIVRAYGTGHLGYWVRSTSTGNGVCTSAARQAVEYAFSHLGFTRIEIHVLVDNIASNLVAEKIGATFEGTLRNKLVLGGEPLPAKTWSIIPGDYGL